MKKNIFSILIILGFIFSGFFVYAEDSTPTDQNTGNPQVEETQNPTSAPLEEQSPVQEIPTEEQPPVEQNQAEEPAPILYENIFIRNGADVVYSGDIALPPEGNIDILDNVGVSHSVNSRSVLGVLYTLDQTEDSFSLSSLQYYDSFSSFYLKCLNTNSSGEACDNWQYVVGGASPWTSIDATILSGGENIGLYFGSPYKVDLDTNTITTTGSITAQAKSYNYTDDTWVVRTGVHIGITQTNPHDPWSPTVISTTSVDDIGRADLSFSIPGTYNIGVSEDYYFPSYSVSVAEPVSSGGSNSAPVVVAFSKENAVAFLNANKKSDGSLGASLYTDWGAVAIGSTGDSALIESIAVYLTSNNFTSSTVTDNERHAMALMSLGINPYSGTSVDYISKIVGKFDGVQIGDVNLDNDDIFGLIVLKKAGYSYKDEIIANTIDFIKTKQYSNGSWDNSADMTSAAIMALSPFKNKNGVSDYIDKAYIYLTSNQSSDGRIGDNVSSTSWAIQALSLGSEFSSALSNARNYVSSQQKSDGGVGDIGSDVDSRVWATSYALTAESLKSWIDILSDFEKPAVTEIVKTSGEDKVEIIPAVIIPIVQEKIVPITPVIQETKKEIKKEEVKKQNKEVKKITPVVRNDIVDSPVPAKNNLVASASSAPFVSKIPAITRVVWHNITTFFGLIFNFF